MKIRTASRDERDHRRKRIDELAREIAFDLMRSIGYSHGSWEEKRAEEVLTRHLEKIVPDLFAPVSKVAGRENTQRS